MNAALHVHRHAASCACALFCNSGYDHDWFAVPSSGEKLKALGTNIYFTYWFRTLCF